MNDIAPPRTLSPGKRWSTTTSSALDEVASQLAGKYDKAGKTKEMRDRKLANSVTSIRFGNDKVNYLTDAKECLKNGSVDVSPAERAEQLARIHKMKADLTVTNFSLGDERPLYETTTARALASSGRGMTSGGFESTKNTKELAKKSSLHFGNEPVAYKTVTQDAMEYKGSMADYTELKEGTAKMKANLRKHNFSFGEEKVLYQTDYRRGFGGVDMAAYRSKAGSKEHMKQVVADSRSCHFSLGQDTVEYQSNTQRGHLDALKGGGNDRNKEISHAKEMKAALQRTSIVIGDDEDYM